MDQPDRHSFTKRTEGLITPKAVGALYGRAEMLGRLPLRVQKWIVDRATKDGQHIGFVVEPYALFLAYEIADEHAARELLPAHYRLLPTGEVERALDIPLDSVSVERNTYATGLLAKEPFEACTFPYAQHYQTTSFPTASPIRDRQSLEQAVERAQR